jgi:hypothetical protein
VSQPSDRPLRVLLTNRVLAHRTGTELYVRDVALGLLQRGHLPVVYSPRLGAVAAELRRDTIPVVDDPTRIAEAPDVIHGHHGVETLTALLAFPGVPAVSVCHSWLGWADEPIAFPRIRRHVAVDDTCRHRLVSEHGVPPDRVEVVLNAVDLQRFRPRPPLPARPARALIFGNYAAEGAAHVQAIRQACSQAGVTVDIAGYKSDAILERPEERLEAYDLVFAKARAALEAAAVGTAVVLCDVAGAGPMVTTNNLAVLRRLNFGIRALRGEPTVEAMRAAIAAYDAADAAAVSSELRKTAGLDLLLDQLLAMYGDVIAEWRACGADLESEQRAAAAVLRRLSSRLYDGDLLHAAFHRLLRVPGVRLWMRLRARREQSTYRLQELLEAMARE